MRLQGTGLLTPGQRPGGRKHPMGPSHLRIPLQASSSAQAPGPALRSLSRSRAGGTAPRRALCGQVWTLQTPCQGADGAEVTKSSEQPNRKQLRGPD